MDKSAIVGVILCTAGDDRYRRNETVANEKKNGTSSHCLGASPTIFANFARKLHLLLDSTENCICYWTVQQENCSCYWTVHNTDKVIMVDYFYSNIA